MSACVGDKTQTPTDTSKNTAIKTTFIQSDLFEIAKIDYEREFLQRIFVVIHPDQVNDTALIRQIIGELKKSYPLSYKSNISFFPDKKYANYKDELFFQEKSPFPESDYQTWRDSYYIGEYDFETQTFITFPFSNFIKRRKVYKIDVGPF